MKRTADISRIRHLIWLYFWLLLFEGALRKWVLPSAANPLLVVRDPVVLAIYFLAWRSGVFPRNSWVLFGGLIAFLTIAASFFAPDGNLLVTLYGARTDFLQLPFIFLIPRVFDSRDVERIGFYVILSAVPIAILMVFQFRSAPSSWINSGVEGTFIQGDSAGGHIRPPGPFSFVSGPSSFYCVLAAFLFHSQFRQTRYPGWLLLSGLFSLIIASAVSGSRTLIASVAAVCFFALVYVLVKLQFKPRWIYCIGILLIGGSYLIRSPFFQEGITIFALRLKEAGRVEGGASGFASRFISDFIGIGPALSEALPLGQGLGVGTSAGAALLTGKAQFMLSEAEWGRIILESGPALGLMFIFYRVSFTLWLFYTAVKQFSSSNPLPFLLFSSCFVLILTGQLGQPSVLGFTVFVSGLCLAASRSSRRESPQLVPQSQSQGRHILKPVTTPLSIPTKRP